MNDRIYFWMHELAFKLCILLWLISFIYPTRGKGKSGLDKILVKKIDSVGLHMVYGKNGNLPITRF